MKPLLALVLASTSCGRLDFAPLADARSEGVADAAEPADLLLHYAFDTTDPRVDSALRPYPGSCTQCPSMIPGRIGPGAAMFSPSSCLQIPGSRVLQPAVFTFAAWLRPRVVHHGTAIGRSRNGATSSQDTFEIWVDATPSWNILAEGARSLGAPIIGEWHHYAGTYDGTMMTAYVDGQLAETKAAQVTAYTEDDVTIGCDLNGGALTQRFDGTLDDIRLYDRVLTVTEVAALAAL